MMKTRPFSWTHATPKGAIGLTLIFAPTRSRIEKVVVAAGRVDGEELSFRSLSVSLTWPKARTDAGRLQLDFSIAGEQLQPLWVDWHDESRSRAKPIGESDLYALIHNERRDRCTTDDTEYLFELDRQTNLHLMRYCISEPELGRRRSALLTMTAALSQRLSERWARVPPTNLSLPDKSLTEYVSRVFVDAMKPLGGKVQLCRHVLERFSAGDYRELLKITVGGKDVLHWINEADSYFLFMFAEFSTVAIARGVDTGIWHELSESMVKMQSYYLKRAEAANCVAAYGAPNRSLTKKERIEVDSFFNRARSASLDQLIGDNLRKASPTCFE